MYLIRLDDAAEYMDCAKWQRVEDILDSAHIVPLAGIIPNCLDTTFTSRYTKDEGFWAKSLRWQNKGWIIGLHGYTHVYNTRSGGINPVHDRSEFAGLPLSEQKEKIRAGYTILKSHSLEPQVFFAPSHTFDENTLEALKTETPIRIICDTIANKIYYKNGFFFLPQQSGRCRTLPFKFTTIALHPNTMEENDFTALERFIHANANSCLKDYNELPLRQKKYSPYDALLSAAYFSMRAIKKAVKRNR